MRKLYLSPNKKFLGVCAGLAEYFNVDPLLVRILVVCISLATAIIPALIIYVILGLVFPAAPQDYIPAEPTKKLTKGNDKKLAGVCSGIAAYFGVDPTIVRLIFALATLFIGYGISTYIVCCIMMPSNPIQVVTDDYNG